jgi:3-hydroxybutyryl-CoA dehydrogenase
MTEAAERPGPPERVVIIGAGTMGAGMALAFARAGSRVQMTSRRQATLDRARKRVQEILDTFGVHGLVAASAKEEIAGRIAMTTSFDALDLGADLVMETIVEDPAEKRDVLSRAERGADPGTIIATNTSSLSLSKLATALQRPQKFAGYHWFNPPELVELVEVVVGPGTEEATTRRLSEWSLAVGKQPVVLRREVDGFVANRLQYALMREAYALVQRGVCSVEDVDRVLTAGLGPRWAAVGPFEAMDLAGLDVHHEVARRLFPSLATDEKPPELLAELVAKGALGVKSGRGLHGAYDEGTIRRLTERRIAVLLAVAAARRAEQS